MPPKLQLLKGWPSAGSCGWYRALNDARGDGACWINCVVGIVRAAVGRIRGTDAFVIAAACRDDVGMSQCTNANRFTRARSNSSSTKSSSLSAAMTRQLPSWKRRIFPLACHETHLRQCGGGRSEHCSQGDRFEPCKALSLVMRSIKV